MSFVEHSVESWSPMAVEVGWKISKRAHHVHIGIDVQKKDKFTCHLIGERSTDVDIDAINSRDSDQIPTLP